MLTVVVGPRCRQQARHRFIPPFASRLKVLEVTDRWGELVDVQKDTGDDRQRVRLLASQLSVGLDLPLVLLPKGACTQREVPGRRIPL